MRISDWSSDVCSSDLDFVEITDDGGQSRPGNILALAADGTSRIRIRSRANKDNTRHNTLYVGRRCYPPADQGFRLERSYGARHRLNILFLQPGCDHDLSHITGVDR